jgi:predicted HTH domain antitoxin
MSNLQTDMVVGHYLAEHQSIGRSAELLGMSTSGLMMRLGRAGVPLGVGPQSAEELEEELRLMRASIRRK